MNKQTEYKGISKRGRDLLNKSEDKYVDYKIKIKGLHAEDLAAFANSDKGGAILIGVEEIKDPNGLQRGLPLGCPIGDEVKLQIMGKALSCSPPVQIELFIENLNSTPFYRIEIPSGSQKPYSTSSGTYKIREDGRNNPILPPQLLKLFLEKEGKEFRNRFTQATGDLEDKMHKTLDLVSNLESAISDKIERIADTMGWTEYKATDAADKIERVEGAVHYIKIETDKIQTRFKSIFKHLDAVDPIKKKAKEEAFDCLVEELSKDKKKLKAILDGNSIEMSGGNIGELTKKELSKALSDAVEKVLELDEKNV